LSEKAMQDDLTQLLDEYSSTALSSIERYHNLIPQGAKTKPLIIEALVKALSDRQYVLQVLNGIDLVERAVVDAILRRGGSASVRNVREELTRLGFLDHNGKVKLIGKGSRSSSASMMSRNLNNILIRLTVVGLVYGNDTLNKPQSHSHEKLNLQQIPTNLIIPMVIRQFMPPPAELPVLRPAEVNISKIQESSARAFQRDLYLYWSFVRDHAPSITLKGELEKRKLREVNAILLERCDLAKTDTENDHPRLRFMRAILNHMRLISPTEGRTLEAGASPTFFTLTPPERVKTTYEAWRDSGAFNELLLLPVESRPKIIPDYFFPAPPPVISARQFVMHQIEKLTPNGWISFKSLVVAVREMNYEFLFARPKKSPHYYRPVNPYAYDFNPLGLEFPGVSGDESGWMKVEANFVQDIVRAPLFWMGLVDLGWEGSQNGFPSAFRLTPLGLWLLQLGPQPVIPEEGGQVIVQPNLHIIALDPIQEATLINLDHFAERLTAERAVEYQLTRLSVYHGQQTGWEVPRIKEFLVGQTGRELPANVARTLDEWQAQYERILIRPRQVIAHGSPAVIDSLAADHQIAQVITARPLPELALLKNKQAIPKVVKTLQARDILPVVISRPAIKPASVAASESGEIRFIRRAPDLYLHGYLASFAEQFGESYRITPASATHAAAAGLTAPEIIERLQAVHSGLLPEPLTRRIRAWARHFGSAALEEVVLFQVRDSGTLSELMDDPEVGALLRPFIPPDAGALALVQSGDLEKLRRLLAERGIELTGRLETHLPGSKS
jgi:hypothetical protein